jgi:hypothetical protein
MNSQESLYLTLTVTQSLFSQRLRLLDISSIFSSLISFESDSLTKKDTAIKRLAVLVSQRAHEQLAIRNYNLSSWNSMTMSLLEHCTKSRIRLVGYRWVINELSVSSLLQRIKPFRLLAPSNLP